MPNFIDLSGKTFSRLTVISRTTNRGKHIMWKCACICGNSTVVSSTHLRSGHTHSCGCYGTYKRTKHEMHGTREYTIYHGMKQRCYNPKATKYENYGGRGITVCADWLTGFAAFYADMGPCPKGHSIDRVNGNLGYSPTNCKWADAFEQGANTRSNVHITHNGETHILEEWGRITGIDSRIIHARIKAGWSVERALVSNP